MHMCFNDKVLNLNGFINVFGRNVLLMVFVNPLMTVMTDIGRGTLSV